MAETAIATWFVADDTRDATFLPQVHSQSDAPEAQAIYWRCTVCFYASSLALNPGAKHIFYTNCAAIRVDGINVLELLAGWGVEIRTVPITWRLPRGAVGAWGNQFYVFDAIREFVASESAERLVLLDSDCLWIKPVEPMETAIDREGALTYRLSEGQPAPDKPINGLSPAGMARFMAVHGGPKLPETPYFGGEVYAATREASQRLLHRAELIWPQVVAGVEDAPREEAHLLSIAYVIEGIASGTCNPFIRRMWTTFKHNNLQPSDGDLTVWHLPAEKKTGFADLFREIVAVAGLHPSRDAKAMGLTVENYARHMGHPRRRLGKFLRDASLKVAEKLA